MSSHFADILIEIADRHALLDRNLPLVGQFLAGGHPKVRRLSHPPSGRQDQSSRHGSTLLRLQCRGCGGCWTADIIERILGKTAWLIAGTPSHGLVAIVTQTGAFFSIPERMDRVAALLP